VPAEINALEVFVDLLDGAARSMRMITEVRKVVSVWRNGGETNYLPRLGCHFLKKKGIPYA